MFLDRLVNTNVEREFVHRFLLNAQNNTNFPLLGINKLANANGVYFKSLPLILSNQATFSGALMNI